MLKGVLNQHIQNSILKLQITDEKFLKLTRTIIDPLHFTAKETATICKVIYGYFDMHKTCPQNHFRNVLQDHLDKVEVNEAQLELYANYLETLDELEVNRDYILSRITQFARRATLKDASIKFAELVSEDNFVEAEALMYEALKSGIQDIDVGTNLDQDMDKRLYRLEETQYLTHFGIDRLDKTLGGMERKTMVVVVAPPKGGKSWMLTHFGVQAYMKGLNVVHFTHEMSEKKVIERYDQNIFKLARTVNGSKEWRDLAADNRAIATTTRTNYHALDDLPYIKKGYGGLKKYSGNLYVKEYPTGTCTVSEIERYLEYLEVTKEFIPDVVISDYGDIMAGEGNHTDERGRIGGIYVRLREVAVSRNILVITASQAVRRAIEAPVVGAQHTAEDIRKVAIADLVLTIARTGPQIAEGQGTIRAAAVREGQPLSFNFGGNLDFGQFYTYAIPEREEEEE